MRVPSCVWSATMVAILSSIILGGSLHGGSDPGVVRFDVIRQIHFDAHRVDIEQGAPSSGTLFVYVKPVGDAAGTADFARAEAFLFDHLNVRIVWSPAGIPVYLTELDLAAKSGRATLGATVSNGIAMEVRDLDIANCVFAHEIGHILGLKHVQDPEAIMSEHCTRGKLAEATVSPAEAFQLSGIHRLIAESDSGVLTWASRR